MASDKKIDDELNELLDSENSTVESKVKQKSKAKAHKYKKGEMVDIILMKSEGKGGDRPVPVNYNGTLYTVPRGIPMKVPGPVYEILRNAQKTLHEWNSETNAIIQREAAAYPVSRQ